MLAVVSPIPPVAWSGGRITVRRALAGGIAPIILLSTALSVGGCGLFQKAPPPAPLPGPNVSTTVSHFVGTPLSGPIRDVSLIPKIDPAKSMVARLSFFSLEKLPDQAL